MAEDAIKLEGAKLQTFSPKAASGEETARLAMSWAVEVDTVQAYMNRLTRLYRKVRSIGITFSGLKMQSAELYTFSPKAAKVTKDGDEKEPPKMVLGFSVELGQVEDKLAHVSRLWRTGVASELTLEAIEQLELPKQQPAQQELANGNGHGKTDLKDTKVVGLTKATKGKAKKKQHQPI